MREPGRLIVRLSHALGLTRLSETVLLPAIADMQHECGEAGPGRHRALVLARGYWSIISGSAFYVALLPARHVRENWSSLDSAGPRLMRQAMPSALFVTIFCVAIFATDISREQWDLGLGIVFLLLPGNLVMALPLAIATGVGWALTRDRSSSPAALAVGLLGAGLVFTVFDSVVPDANQAYRLASYEAKMGRSIPLRRGSREMTLSELGAATALAETVACPRQAAGCSGVNESSARFHIEWHKRLSIPALALSLVGLAAALSRSGRRLVVLPVLWIANGVMYILLRLAEPYGLRGDVPIVVAAWGGHLVALTLAAVLHFTIRDQPADEGIVKR